MANPVGRPLKFKTVEELRKKIDGYFEMCDSKDSKEIYTVTGLCLFLDCDRDTLVNYSKREEFFGSIKKAKLKIEKSIEIRLMTTMNVAGAIFNLKNNFGWKDRQEIDSNISIEGSLDTQLTQGRQKIREELEKKRQADEK